MRSFQYLIILFTAVFLVSSCSPKHGVEGTFSYSPEQPKPGDEITVNYLADSTNLAGADSVILETYLYGVNLDNTIEYPMTKEGDYWTAKFPTTDSTLGILIKFKHKDDIDNNNKKGYSIIIYKDGKVIPGAYAGLASAINTWGSYYLEMDRNAELADSYFQKDFEANPGIKDKFLDPYFSVNGRIDKDKADSLIKSELHSLELKNPVDLKDLTLLAKWYAKIGDKEKADGFKKMLEEKYPKSEYVQRQLFNEFYAEKDINKKLSLAKEFENKYPESDYISTVYDLIANYYRDSKDYKKAAEFLKNNTDKPSIYRFYAVASKMADENADLNDALEISKLGVDRSRKEIDTPKGKKPNWESENEWKTDREYILGLNLYAYGEVLSKLGKNDEALNALEQAVKFTKEEEGDLNELYVQTLSGTGNNDKILTVVPDFIKKGKDTPAMQSILKKAYMAKNGNDKGYNEFLAKFESAAKDKLIKDLKKEMVDNPAPDFSLTDLNGEKVSLSQLKGKTVVLDFWATWCGPCKASFPGMQKAVQKFSNNDNIKFFFVNSWENVKDKKKNAEDFIKKNNYPFRVLLDSENKVIDSYRVSGIPTKFIIDKKGDIRFMSVGFSGNTDQMVEEISQMIAMVN